MSSVDHSLRARHSGWARPGQTVGGSGHQARAQGMEEAQMGQPWTMGAELISHMSDMVSAPERGAEAPQAGVSEVRVSLRVGVRLGCR